MSFDLNLSSDDDDGDEDEDGFQNWATVDLKESITLENLGRSYNKNKNNNNDDDDDDDNSRQFNFGYGDDDDDGVSSSDEEDDYDDARKKDGTEGIAFIPLDNGHFGDGGGGGGDYSDDDNVDWEDATEEDGTNANLGFGRNDGIVVGNNVLKPITVDFDDSKTKDDKKKSSASSGKKKSRRQYRFEHLSLELQNLLSNIEKTYMLGLTAHVMYASTYCSEDEQLHIAQSLIAPAWFEESSGNNDDNNDNNDNNIPTEDDVGNFCNFFFSLTNQSSTTTVAGTTSASAYARRPNYARRRTTRRGSKRKKTSNNKAPPTDESNSNVPSKNGLYYRLPEYCENLSNSNNNNNIHNIHTNGDNGTSNNGNNDDKFNGYDRLHLLLSMVRSMGWRARYVTAIEPFKKDLNVDHPLFTVLHAKNVFQWMWRQSRSSSSSKHKARKNHHNKQINDDDDDDDASISIKSTQKKQVDHNNNEDDDEDDELSKKPAAKKTKLNETNSSVNDDTDMDNLLGIGKMFGGRGRAKGGDSSSPGVVCWIEILCRCDGNDIGQRKQGKNERNITKSNKKPSSSIGAGTSKKTKKKKNVRWIHVDPCLRLVNQPEKVEVALYAQKHGLSLKRVSKKVPIAFALAAEHVPVRQKRNDNDNDDDKNDKTGNDDTSRTLRLVDVTPRYAHSMVESLKMRGVIRGKQTKVKEEDRIDIWWSKVIQSINKRGKRQGHVEKKLRELQSKGKSIDDAIILDEESSGVNRIDNTTKEMAPTEEEDGDDDVDVDVDDIEREELQISAKDEPIPTSKVAFKSHPLYVLASLLNQDEVLTPTAKKHICGMFKGELVYRRSDVEKIYTAKRWLYHGRQVVDEEVSKPIKRLKVKKKGNGNGKSSFKALKSYGVDKSINDGSEVSKLQQIEVALRPLGDDKESYYASWQTKSWSPVRILPTDDIPVNEYNNIELQLLNPGLIHIDVPKISIVAKRLGIPYAPCLVGFEGHNSNRVPTIRGIVIHEHNKELILEANVEMSNHLLEQHHEQKQKEIYMKWKRLFVGILTKERLDRAYGDNKKEGGGDTKPKPNERK